MNLKFYIESGILEQYALGLLSEAEKLSVKRMLNLHVELRDELERIQSAMENYASSRAVQPRSEMRDIVIGSIVNLQKEKIMDIKDLPLINKFSDYNNWLGFLATLGEMPLGDDGKFVKVLRCDERVTQMLITSSTDIEEEVHSNEHESFLILSGQCKCTISGNERLMGPGEFMSIPLYEPHDVALLSKTVTAILQRVKI